MSKTRFVIDTDGVRENILNADFTLEECERVAKEKAAGEFSDGYHMISFKGTQRAHAIALPNTRRNPG